MTLPWLSEMTWKEVAGLDRSRVVALLPVGAIEAHGPHLPLATDGIIAEAMAAAAARRLAGQGWLALGLPTLAYTAAPFGRRLSGYPVAAAGNRDGGDRRPRGGSQRRGIPAPGDRQRPPRSHPPPLAPRRADAARDAGLTVAFPDLTRKPWALRLTAEFKSGACHAGCFESSIVLAARGDLVRESLRSTLSANPASLSQAIRAGKATFAEASGPEAYFGDPAAATREEGEETLETLGAILEEAVLDSLGLRT